MQAVDALSLSVGSITAKAWHLQGVSIALSELNKTPQQLVLTIDKLQLPVPQTELSVLDIRCTTFTLQTGDVRCQHGQASLHSPQWQTRTAQFSFAIQQQHSTFSITDLHCLGGVARLDGEAQGDNWSLNVKMKAADGKALLALLSYQLFKISAGNVDVDLQVSGDDTGIKTAQLSTDVKQLTGQTDTGRFATENLSLTTQLNAQNTSGIWQWQSYSQLNTGALYAEPLFLKVDGQAISLSTQGLLNTATRDIAIETLNFQHLPTGTVNGTARLNYKKELSLEQAQFTLRSHDLQSLASVYLKPFFTETFLDSLDFTGHLNAEFTLSGLSLTALAAHFNQLAITDSAERLTLKQGLGDIYWSANKTIKQPSSFSWQQLQLYGLPIGATQLRFLSNAANIELLTAAQLPFLGGDIHIKQFKLDDNKVTFQGDMNQVSLQQLSQALKWQPLTGTLSGHISQVNYVNKKLTLEGELLIKVFAGTVKIAKLAAANLFAVLPTFYSDIEIERLDLEQLTSKYKFGNITGKLSGFVKQLQIENGQPIGFLAWLGSPDNDDTPHRISQKAVNNIAQIGGSGASDLVSRSFLKLFDTFGYDKIGLGCYLHEGVCQLSGVTATDTGYTIVLGGGVPRIDVIGYNTRVDWAVLMNRLARLSTSDNVIVQ